MTARMMGERAGAMSDREQEGGTPPDRSYERGSGSIWVISGSPSKTRLESVHHLRESEPRNHASAAIILQISSPDCTNPVLVIVK